MTSPARGSSDPYGQAEFGVRFDWGMQGATAISATASAVIVVDVLSFTTTLSVAVDLGIEVYPYRFRDASAAAAGERWPGDTLRPAVEDLWGSGLVIDALAGLGAGPLSPEATAACAAHQSLGRPAQALGACASGRELAGAGHAEEIAVAAEIDVSVGVPVLSGDAFRLG